MEHTMAILDEAGPLPVGFMLGLQMAGIRRDAEYVRRTGHNAAVLVLCERCCGPATEAEATRCSACNKLVCEGCLSIEAKLCERCHSVQSIPF